jgi:hypothetical protein
MAGFLCRIGRHDWAQKKSEDGQPLVLAGHSYQRCLRCDAVRKRLWGGGDHLVGGGGAN